MIRREAAMPASLLVILAVVMLFLLSSCASLGLPSAKSTEDKLVYGYAAIQQTASATESLFRQKHLSKEKAAKIFEALKISLNLLDQARDLHFLGKSKEATETLERSTSTLAAAKEQLKGGSNAPGT